MARRSLDPVRRPTANTRVVSVDAAGARRELPDRVTTEEPMEIRIKGPGEVAQPVTVTMRTPGNDFELALGLLFAEGLITSPADIEGVAYCLGADGEQEYNVVTVSTRRPTATIPARSLMATSSCGVCGKATLDELATTCATLEAVTTRLSEPTVRSLPELLRAGQGQFAVTGGLHAAALVRSDGHAVCVREDVGRHNAVDKVIGHALLEGLVPLHSYALMLSGRVGFELVQKAAVAGIPIVCAVGAPSSLAVETAREFGITLVAFVRDGRFNVYHRAERIES